MSAQQFTANSMDKSSFSPKMPALIGVRHPGRSADSLSLRLVVRSGFLNSYRPPRQILRRCSWEQLRHPNYRISDNLPFSPCFSENVELPPATQNAANKRSGYHSFMQTRVETHMRQRNDSGSLRECLSKIFQAISISRHDVEQNGIGINESPRKVSMKCSRKWPLGA